MSRLTVSTLFIIAVVGLPCAEALGQVQTNPQQVCFEGLHKAASKVVKVQGKTNQACIAAAVAGKEPDPSLCMSTDLKGKVAKAQNGTQAVSDMKCGTTPDFGYVPVSVTNDVAVAASQSIISDVLGSDLQTPLVGVDKATGGCQRAVAKGTDKLWQLELKLFNACQATALKTGAASDGTGLIDGCHATVGADANGVLTKNQAKFARDVEKRCSAVDYAAALAGSCSTAADVAALATCLGQRASCRACQATNGLGALSGDCDTFDDGVANASCGSTLAICGNGELEDGEECDDGVGNSDTLPDACRTDCRVAACADGVIDAGEQCDDGAANSDYDDSSCRADCSDPFCGDGILDSLNGEQCDDANALEGDFCTNGCVAQSWAAPSLLLIIDFAGNDVNSTLPDAENEWAGLMFGNAQGQANSYWNEIFDGRFALQPAVETCGTADNGVIVAKISSLEPSGSDSFVVEQQTWVPEALDIAAACLNFDSYDTDLDGVLSNDELSVLVVLNTSFSYISGAGAQANINLNYPIGGTSVVQEKFSRTMFNYGSIGVNVHELGHHIFELKHFAGATDHGVMGLGAYGEDPGITVLSGGLGNWGTRPTGPTSFSRMRAGSDPAVTPDWQPGTTTIAVNSIDSGNYNIVRLPLPDGYLLAENRRSVGYDQSIPFCNGDAGGVFLTEISQYISGLDVVNIDAKRDSVTYSQEFELCNLYSLAGKDDAFAYGGYQFSNFSAAGPSMTFDVTRTGTQRTIAAYKWRWFKNDPERVGYRLWHHEEALESVPVTVDFLDIPGGDDPYVSQTFVLKAYYDTGEERSVNKPANWSISGDYLTLTKSDVTGGPGTTVGDAIVRLDMNVGTACESDALLTAEYEGRIFEAFLVNLPCDTSVTTTTITTTSTTTTTLPPLPPECLDVLAPDWVENGDGTTTQCATGLIWEMKTSDGSIHDRFDRYTWSTGSPWNLDGTVVADFLNVLNDTAGGGVNCFAGNCDWRLPTSNELAGRSSLGAATGGIVDPSAGTCTGSSADCTTIPGETTPAPYMSATTSSGADSFVYLMQFSSGNVQHGSKEGSYYVRAVRP
jgi:M6 family metalloprotease-like protein